MPFPRDTRLAPVAQLVSLQVFGGRNRIASVQTVCKPLPGSAIERRAIIRVQNRTSCSSRTPRDHVPAAVASPEELVELCLLEAVLRTPQTATQPFTEISGLGLLGRGLRSSCRALRQFRNCYGAEHGVQLILLRLRVLLLALTLLILFGRITEPSTRLASSATT